MVSGGGGGKSTPQTDLLIAISKPHGVNGNTSVTFPRYVVATKWSIFGNSTTTWKIKMAAAIQGFCLFFHIDNL